MSNDKVSPLTEPCGPARGCAKIRELIPLGISRDRNPVEMAVLENHLAECPECQKEFAAYQALQASLKQISAQTEVSSPVRGPQLTDTFWTAQADRILMASREVSPLARGCAPVRTMALAYILRYAAVFLVGIFGGLVIWHEALTDKQVMPKQQAERERAVTTESRPKRESPVSPQGIGEVSLLGAQLRPLTRPVASHLGLNRADGMVITQLADSTPARNIGLKIGDIIIEINGQAITSTLPGLSGQIDIKIIRQGNVITIGNK